MIVKSLIRKFIKEKGYRLGKEVDVALTSKIIFFLTLAMEKAKADGRKTVTKEDVIC